MGGGNGAKQNSRRAKLNSNQIIITWILSLSYFTGQMAIPILLPNQRCQCTYGKMQSFS